jgi:hypothetical protein
VLDRNNIPNPHCKDAKSRWWPGPAHEIVAIRFPFRQAKFWCQAQRNCGRESLIELFGQALDRGELYAKIVRDHRLRLAHGELDADFQLRWRGAAFAQHACGVRDGVLAQLDRHSDEAAFRIPGDICGNCTCWHEPFRFERDYAVTAAFAAGCLNPGSWGR